MYCVKTDCSQQFFVGKVYIKAYYFLLKICFCRRHPVKNAILPKAIKDKKKKKLMYA